LLFFSIIHHHTHTTNSSSLYKNKKGVSAENRHSDRPAQCQVCNNKKPKALVKRKGVQIWMCKPCAVETNDLFASVGTVNIDTLAAVASLDPGAAAPLPTPPEWTGTIDMRHLPQLPQLPPLPTPPPPSSSSIESESDSLPSPKDIPLPETPPTWNIQPTSPRVDAPDSPSPTRLCTICAKRPAKHRATTKSGQNIVLCAKCATAIRNKPLPKSASIRSGSGVSISSASNAELAAMANATAAGAATLKRVNNKVCQRCNQNQALLKANMGTRVVILCELCVADVREHRLARSAQTPTGLCQRCGAADATRVQQRSNGSTSHVCTACSAKATLVVKR
jgi:ribosomal protein L37AE/L43A